MERAELRVLFAAYEEAPLWELTLEVRNYSPDGSAVFEPPIPREEVGAALVTALSRGDVTLYDRDDCDKRDIELEEALRIVNDDRFWSAAEAPAAACLFLTEVGLKRLDQPPG